METLSQFALLSSMSKYLNLYASSLYPGLVVWGAIDNINSLLIWIPLINLSSPSLFSFLLPSTFSIFHLNTISYIKQLVLSCDEDICNHVTQNGFEFKRKKIILEISHFPAHLPVILDPWANLLLDFTSWGQSSHNSPCQFSWFNQNNFQTCIKVGPQWCTVFIADFGFFCIISAPTETPAWFWMSQATSLIAACYARASTSAFWTIFYLCQLKIGLMIIIFQDDNVFPHTVKTVNSFFLGGVQHKEIASKHLIIPNDNLWLKFEFKKKNKKTYFIVRLQPLRLILVCIVSESWQQLFFFFFSSPVKSMPQKN